ncbi:S-adenosyl-L-methionine-dependent methyltransferase, partial [Pluteus cervinus]
RLNFQHNSLSALFDDKLILAPVSFSKGDRILDCGTGTGIWATEVARDVPDVLVEGTDISTRFFPLPGEISAVTFHNLSTFDLPPQWENRFNLINQRLMVMCFSRAQWEAALQNIHRVLKPGGWVQLIEVKQKHGFSATHPRFQPLLNATQTMMKERDFLIDPGVGLEEILKESGFKEVIRTSKVAPIGEWGGDRG